MKAKTTLLFFTIALFIGINSMAQRITLSELHSMSSNKNWETTNKMLLAQKWDYYDSSQGDDEHYNITTWAFGRNAYNDNKATAWIKLYTFDGLPNKINYRFRNKDYYNAIQNQIKANNYKLTSENIFDSRVTVSYENANYYLQMSYNREEGSDDDYNYSSSNKVYTVYEVVIYKKGGVYDPDNGLKKDYDEDGNLIAVYTLKNGKINGDLLIYFPEGKLKRKSTLINGLYEGNSEVYSYLDNGDILKNRGSYKNDMQEGKWIWEIISDKGIYIINEVFFSNGLKEGKSIETNGEDEIIFKNYTNDKLNGKCKIFLNVSRTVFGGYPTIDTLNISIVKIEELNYLNDKLNGTAKRFDISGSLIEEGKYLDSLKTGEWKIYHKNIIDENGNKLDYASKIYLIENYSKGMLNGKFEQFSFLDKIKIQCEKVNEEDCFKYEIVYFNLLCYYKDDQLDGEYVLKNNEGELLSKGYYSNGQKTGEWIEYGNTEFTVYTNVIPSYETGNYSNDLKEDKWERFSDNGALLETYYYKNDKIHGKHITFLNGVGVIHRYFWNGKLNKIEFYNGEKLIRSVEIVSDHYDKYTVIDTKSNEDITELITVKVTKESDDVMDPRYFFGNYVKTDTSYKIKEGRYELKNSEDKIVSKGNYDNDTKNGDWTENYYDQQIKTTFKYSYGKLIEENYFDLNKNQAYSGEFIFKDTENNITEERKIKNGKRHGTTRYKDQNNKTIRKESYKEGVLKE